MFHAVRKTIATPESSNIAEFSYYKGVEAIKFKNGGLYVYPNTPSTLHAAFCRAKSKGRFFAKHFRNCPCAKVN